MKRKSVLFLLLFALFAPWAAHAQTELTVCDGTTTNSYVPFYGYMGDAAQHNQMIYPASDLTDMVGMEIYQMAFYVSSGSTTLNNWTISLGETTATTLSSLDQTTVLAQVYSGSLVGTSGVMTIVFDNGYVYNGGNLLVDFNHPASNWGSYSFYGIEATSAAYTYNAVRNFLPKNTFSYQTPPTCLKPTDFTATANLQSATLTWESDATQWAVAHSTDANADPSDNVVTTVSSATYTMNNLAIDQDHYFWVRANCSATDQSAWAGPVSVHIGYCVPAPASMDGTGITNVAFGIEPNIVNNATTMDAEHRYLDCTSEIGAVQAGVEAEVVITYGHTYTYGTFIWVDLNNDLDFEDEGEILYYGQSGSSSPNVLTAHITIPATQAIGDYRMRIGGSDSGFDGGISSSDPCYTGSWAAFQDYTLRVLEAPSCLVPTGLNLAASDTSVTATWEGTASTYNIDINGTVTPNVTSPYTFTGEYFTTYTVQVQSNCDGGETSDWCNPQSITTPCGPIALPYDYGFEDAGDMNCWTVIATSSSTGIASASDAPEGSMVFRFHYQENPNAYLISPAFTGTSNGMTVSFQYMNSSTTTSYTEEFQVGYNTTGSTDPTAFTYGETIYGANEWLPYEYDFPANTKRIAIKYIYTDGMYLRLDDFHFEVSVSCKRPKNLAVSEITAKTADLSWTAGGEETAWQICINGDESNLTDVDTNPYTLDELTPYTPYTVKVRANCGEGDFSDWSNEISFTTDVTCHTPDSLNVSDITPFSANVTWIGDAESYNLRYGIPDAFIYTFESATPWVEDNFAPCTTYDGDGLTTYQITDWTPLGTYQFVGSMMTLQSGVTDFGSAHGGELFGGFVAGIPADGVTNNDDYFILPAITIADGDVFEFWAKSLLDNWGLEHMRVGVYGGNGTFTQYLAGSATEYVEVPEEWTKYSYDLSAFAGQSIQLAINSLCPDAYILGIDDIFVGNPDNVTWIETVADATSPYALADLIAETNYVVKVQADCGDDDGTSDWTSMYFTTLSNCAEPFALSDTLVMTTSATLRWEGYQESYNLRYRKPTTTQPAAGTFFDDFENGLGNWTLIVNAEGTGWQAFDATQFSSITNYSGNYVAMARSYENGVDLTADNWMITPQLTIPSTMTYWARNDGRDDHMYDETYDVCVSVNTNDVGDFVVVQSFTTAPEDWGQITIDLSAYEGQQGYIAFHHHDAEKDMILIDDVTIGSMETVEYEWIDREVTNATNYNVEGLEAGTEYEWQVQGINPSCDGGVTEWSDLATFTTAGLCDDPINLAVTDTTATTATLSWLGYQDAFNVQYRSAEVIDDIQFFDGCSSQGNWTTSNLETDNEGGSGWDLISGYFTFIYTSNPPQYLISPEIEAELNNSTLWFQYLAYGGTEYPETFQVGFSTTDNDVNSFTWGEEVTATNDEEFLSYAVTIPNDAKYFAVKCTSDNQFALVLDNFVICDTYVAPGEWVSVPNVTSPVTIDGLTPNTEYDWAVRGICGDEDYTEWVYSWFTTTELTNITQTIALASGVNWVSFYVETTLNELKAALVEAMPMSGVTIAAKDGGQTFYNGTRWRGALSSLDMAQMYRITVPADCEISLDSILVDPANHPITIKNGLNWIGYPFMEGMTIANAFAGFAVSGDEVRAKDDGIAKYVGTRWRGALTNLVPGQGYIYNSAATGDRTFVFPTSSKAYTPGSSFNFSKTISLPANAKFEKNSSDFRQVAMSKMEMSNKNRKSINK